VESAVLLVIFRRPETTSSVFEAVRAAQPPRLYIAADGPRVDHPDDAALCAATRDVVEQIDWPCEVTRLYHDTNVGLVKNLVPAVDTMMDREGEGIILEDDTVPTQTFFDYCDALLARYRDDERVGVVSGYNPAMSTQLDGNVHYFSELPMTWGWATWQRAWQGQDATFKQWPGDTTGFPPSIMRTYGAPAAWVSWLERVRARDLPSVWDYVFFYHCWVNERLAVLPGRSLVTNVGFGAEATHTTGAIAPKHIRRIRAVEQPPPLKPASEVATLPKLDAAILSSYYKLGRAAAARQALVPLRNKLWPRS